MRSWFAGSSVKPDCSTGTSAAASSHSPSSTSQELALSCDLSMPQPMVALPCGSRSISSTRRRVAASEAARLTAVVVLPTPPFWLAMAMTRFMGDSVLHCRARKPAPTARLEPEASGDQRSARLPQALARHLVGHGVGGAVLAPGALEDLRQAHRDPWMSAITCASVAPPRYSRETLMMPPALMT